MMKQLFMTMVAILALSSAAMTSANAAQKIGAVDLGRLLQQAPQAKEAQRQLENEFADEKRELEQLRTEVENIQARLKRDELTMSAGERDRLARQVQEKAKNLKRRGEDISETFMRRSSKLGVAFQQGLLGTIQRMAREEGYDLIVGEGVIYAGKSIDMTDKVLARLQSEFDAVKR